MTLNQVKMTSNIIYIYSQIVKFNFLSFNPYHLQLNQKVKLNKKQKYGLSLIQQLYYEFYILFYFM